MRLIPETNWRNIGNIPAQGLSVETPSDVPEQSHAMTNNRFIPQTDWNSFRVAAPERAPIDMLITRFPRFESKIRELSGKHSIQELTDSLESVEQTLLTKYTPKGVGTILGRTKATIETARNEANNEMLSSLQELYKDQYTPSTVADRFEVAKAMGLSPAALLKNNDLYLKLAPTIKLREGIAESFTNSMRRDVINARKTNILIMDVIFNEKDTYKDHAGIQKLNKILEGIQEPIHKGFLNRTVEGTASLWSQGIRAIETSLFTGKGIAATLAFAGIGGKLGATAGSAGGPIGVAAGAKLGAITGARRAFSTVGAIQMGMAYVAGAYEEMRASGVDHETARMSAMAAGALTLGLNYVNFDTWMKWMPGLGQNFSPAQFVKEVAATKTGGRMLQKVGERFLWDRHKNAVLNATQEAAVIIPVELAKHKDGIKSEMTMPDHFDRLQDAYMAMIYAAPAAFPGLLMQGQKAYRVGKANEAQYEAMIAQFASDNNISLDEARQRATEFDPDTVLKRMGEQELKDQRGRMAREAAEVAANAGEDQVFIKRQAAEEYNQAYPDNPVSLEGLQTIGEFPEYQEVMMTNAEYQTMIQQNKDFEGWISSDVRHGSDGVTGNEAMYRNLDPLMAMSIRLGSNTEQGRDARFVMRRFEKEGIQAVKDAGARVPEQAIRDAARMFAAYTMITSDNTGVPIKEIGNLEIQRGIKEVIDGYNQFGGRRLARTAEQKLNLRRANEMLMAGKHWDEVRKATGWFLGADGMMRREINDNLKGMGMGVNRKDMPTRNTIKMYSLESIYDNAPLYEAYPELKSINVQFWKSSSDDPNLMGWYSPNTRQIGISPGLDNNTKKLVLIHEIQHAIQEIEGFAKGASPEQFQVKLDNNGNIFSEFDQYWNTIGEQEARDASNRAIMSEEMRKNTPPDINGIATQFAGKTIPMSFDNGKNSQLTEAYNQLAYQGSPWRFTKYDIGKVNSGEGAQYFGWGLYFAQLKDIADWYKNVLGEKHGVKGTTYKVEIPESTQLLDRNKRISEQPEFVQNIVERMANERNIDLTNYDAMHFQINGEDVYNARGVWEAQDGAELDMRFQQALNTFRFRYGMDVEKAKKGSPADFLDPEMYKFSQDLYQSLVVMDNVDIELTGGDFYKALSQSLGIGKDKEASLLLKLEGIEGLQYTDAAGRGRDAERSLNFVIFDDQAIQILETYEQKEQQKNQKIRKAAININRNGKATISLFQHADASSLFHEVSHKMLDDFSRYGMLEAATEQYRSDAEAAFHFVGIEMERFKTLQAERLQALDSGDEKKAEQILDILSVHQERFAAGFEAYISTGKAPSRAMKNVFSRTRKYMLAAYGDMGIALDLEITPEVQKVFDRLLAMPEEINQQTLIRDIAAFNAMAKARESELSLGRLQTDLEVYELFGDAYEQALKDVDQYFYNLMARDVAMQDIEETNKIYRQLRDIGRIKFDDAVEMWGKDKAQNISKQRNVFTRKKGRGLKFQKAAENIGMSIEALSDLLEAPRMREPAPVAPVIPINNSTYNIFLESLGKEGLNKYIAERRRYLKRIEPKITEAYNKQHTTETNQAMLDLQTEQDAIRTAERNLKEAPEPKEKKRPTQKQILTLQEAMKKAYSMAKAYTKTAYKEGVAVERARQQAMQLKKREAKELATQIAKTVKEIEGYAKEKNIKNMAVRTLREIQKVLKDYDLHRRSEKVLDRRVEIEKMLLDDPDAANTLTRDEMKYVGAEVLNNMTLGDLMELRDRIKSMAEEGYRLEAERQAKLIALQKPINEALHAAVKKHKAVVAPAVRSKKDLDLYGNSLLKIFKGAVAALFDAQRMFDYIGGGHDKGEINAFVRTFVDPANAARSEKYREIFRRQDWLSEQTARPDININPDKLGDVIYTDQHGVEWTYDQAIDLYISQHNEKRKKAVLRSDNLNRRDPDTGKPYYENPEEFMTQLVDMLPDNYKRFGDLLVQEQSMQIERVNNILEQKLNRRINVEPWYLGMNRLERNLNTNIVDGDLLASVQTQDHAAVIAQLEDGWMIDRLNVPDSGQKPIEIGAMANWERVMMAQEHMLAYADVARTMVAGLMSKEGDYTLAQQIKMRHGDKVYKSVISHLNTVITDKSGQAKDIGNDWASRMAGNMSMTYLCWNFGTVAVQFTSYPLGIGHASPWHLIKALYDFAFDHKNFLYNDLDGAYVLDPQLRARTGKGLAQLLTGRSQMSPILRAGFESIAWMDRLTATCLQMAIFRSNKDKGMSVPDALREAQRVVKMTQMATHAMDKPMMWQMNGLGRLAMIFTADAAKYLNIGIYDVPRALRRGEYQSALMTAVGFGLSAMMFHGFKTGGPREDETWAEWAGKVSASHLIRSIPLLGAEFDMIFRRSLGDKVYSSNASNLSAPFLKLYQGVTEIAKDQTDWTRAASKLLESLALMPFWESKIPYMGIRRLGESGYQMLEGNYGTALAQGVLGYRIPAEERGLR